MPDDPAPSEPSPPDDPAPKPGGVAGFWAELKRRHVVRVATVYLVVGWLVIQVANATFAEFGIPLWAYRFVVIVLWLFFPVAIILTWAFELTPDGVKTTKNAREEQGDSPVFKSQQRRRNWMAIGFAAGLPTLIFGILTDRNLLFSGAVAKVGV